MGSFRLPGLLVAAFLLGSMRMVAAQDPATGPTRIDVRPASWDLGTVSPGQYQQVFEIVNLGGEPLLIDQVRVSHPLRMSASVSPLGTEPGRRFQLTVVVTLDGTEPAFAGYAIVHSNDKARPHVKIDIVAKLPASSGTLLIFYSEEGPGIKKIRERLAALKLEAEVISCGDLANLDRLRQLEKDHGVVQTAAYELFLGRECLLASDPEDVLKAIERVASGGALQGRKVHPHQHDPEKKAEAATIATLLPPPVSVDLFLDPGCASCVEAGRRFALELNAKYAGRVAFSARDITHPDTVKLFQDRLAPKDFPAGTHAVALVAGATWVSGEIPAILQALPPIVDRELAAVPGAGSGARAGVTPPAEPPAAKPSASTPPDRGDGSVLQWAVLAVCVLTLLRVSLLRGRGAEPPPTR